MADATPKTGYPPVPTPLRKATTADDKEDGTTKPKPEDPLTNTGNLPDTGSELQRTSPSEERGKAAAASSTTEQEGEVRGDEKQEEEDEEEEEEINIDELSEYDRRLYLNSLRRPEEFDSWFGRPPPSPRFVGPAKETLRAKTSRLLDENTLPWTKFKPPTPKPACLVFHNAQRYLLEDKETRMPRGIEIRENMKRLLGTARSEPYYPGADYPMICFVNDEENVGLSFTDAYVEKRVVYPLAGHEDISELTAAKSKGSKFFRRDNTLSDLKSKGVQKIFMMGGPSDRDVIWSCKGARKQGFEVTLISGCHGAFDSETEWHWEIERRIEEEARSYGCEVVPFHKISLDWEMDGVVN